jgi:2-oxoglutarate dehydrogenase E1 component
MKDFSYITSSSPAFIENMYLEFVKDPNSVDPEMKKFFEGFDFAIDSGVVAAKSNGNGKVTHAVSKTEMAEGIDWRKELGTYRMILGYRNKGHLIAKTNPIRERKDRDANLNLQFFGLSEEDLDKTFQVGERYSVTSAKGVC